MAGTMKNPCDYSQYKCPYEHLDKICGHELKGPEGFADAYGVWCACGFRGPVFYLNPEDLGLERKSQDSANPEHQATRQGHYECDRETGETTWIPAEPNDQADGGA